MMAKNCILCNSLDLLIRHIIYIAITEECICRIFCKCNLKLCICFFTLILITCLSCLCQISVYLFIGISTVITSFICTKHFICMVISIKRASPSDQAGHLSAPVHLCRNFYGTVDSGFPELLCCCIAALPVKQWLETALQKRDAAPARAVLTWGPKLAAMALLACSYCKLVTGSFNPFIYFRF